MVCALYLQDIFVCVFCRREPPLVQRRKVNGRQSVEFTPFPFLSRRYKFSCWISFFINIFTKWRTLKIRSIFDESWKRVTSFCYSFALELLDPITTEGTYILRWNRLSKKVWKSISQSIHDNSIRLENHSNSIKSKFRFQFTLFSLLLSLILYWSKYVHIYLPSFSYCFLF